MCAAPAQSEMDEDDAQEEPSTTAAAFRTKYLDSPEGVRLSHPRGVQPPPPKNHFLDEPSGDAAMRMRDGRMLRHDPAPSHGDAHTGYRMWLEDLLHLPDDCGDDDCILR